MNIPKAVIPSAKLAKAPANEPASQQQKVDSKESCYQTPVQCKLTVGSPDDPLEKEADDMADKVMRMQMPEPINFSSARNTVQRKCHHCDEEEKQLQKKESSSDSTSVAPPIVHDVINSSGGKLLDVDTRAYMEPRFKYDFSKVKIHDNDLAAKSASSINALAYTSGNNVVFNSGQYNTTSDSGKRLLAHELTHVVQQSVNVSLKIQRQRGDDEKEPTSEIGKALNENELFQKLPKIAKDKILDEIDKAPETITKAVLDKIIDLAPIDEQYKEGLKKVGEAIIDSITNKKPVSTSKCDTVPGYHEGTSSDYKGMCCLGTTESEMACCPKDKFAPNNTFTNCCKADEFVNAESKCEKQSSIDPGSICIPPAQKDSLGICCKPPFIVTNGICKAKTPPPAPTPPPFSLKFTIGVVDDYNINESVINSRQKTHFNEVKKQIHQFMEACPSSMITISGFTDKPGTEDHNMELGQRRADYIKFLLQMDLMDINTGGLPPLIFTRTEGENNPVDTGAGIKFSSRNRRVEIEFNSICPPLGIPSLTKPVSDATLQPGKPLKFNTGNF